MTSIFANSAAILTLAAFVACTVLGGLSHWRGLLTGRIGPAHTVLVRSAYGKVLVEFHATDAGEQPRWLWASWPHEFALASPNLGGWWRYGGFGLAIGGTRGGNVVRQLSIPYWSLAFASLLLAAALALRPAGKPTASPPSAA